MRLALRVYSVTKVLPDDERFGLTAQMRRAAYSIPSNLAEGRGRGSDRDFARFVSMASGSLNELETQAMLAAALKHIDKEQLDTLLIECSDIGRMLGTLRSLLLNPSTH